jgi:hypothetical protein
MAGVMERVTGADVLRQAERVMLRPWDWARDWHCLGDAADVFKALWGVDPIANLRGLAGTFGAARRIVRAAGSLDVLAEREFAAAGLVKGVAVPGAIAVGPSGGRTFGGRVTLICVAPGVWLGKTMGGFANRQWDGEGWACRS